VKTWDVIVVGAGIIGLSLAISLRKQGLRVLIIERGEPGREASYAAAGMLAGSGAEIPAKLRLLAEESARLYPVFVHELEDESGSRVDLREQGTILLSKNRSVPENAERLSRDQLQKLEPELATELGGRGHPSAQNQVEAAFLNERSVDPRALTLAAIKAAKHRGVDMSSGTEVTRVITEDGRVSAVATSKTSYAAAIVVNCAGAWAGCIGPQRLPVKPVKGQMLAVIGEPHLNHVIRSEKVYLVPRTDGRIVIGSTLEDAGYDKRVEVDTIEELFQAATKLVPALARSRQHEAWAGLRPATPDELPILGETSTPGYFVATGHYRDGILLAPITAQVMTDLILRRPCAYDLAKFAASRFQESKP
jgi:glycine oxidase